MHEKPQEINEYSKLLLEHLHRPRNVGTIDIGGHGTGRVIFETRPEVVTVAVRIIDGHIVEACHITSGDANGLLGACASFITSYITGLRVQEAVDMFDLDVVRDLRLPERFAWMASMVLLAVLEAIQDCRAIFGPWHEVQP